MSPFEVPSEASSHWSFETVRACRRRLRLRYLTTKIGSGKTPKGGNEVYSGEGIIFLRSQNIYDDGLRLNDVACINEQLDQELYQTRVRAGDVLLNIKEASIDRSAIVPDLMPPANVNQHVCIIRLRPSICPRFVSYTIKSTVVKDQIRSFENGSSREGLNFEQVGNLVLCLPNESIEQQSIADFLDRKTAQIDALIGKKQRQIELLQEKRQALISEAVTKGLDSQVLMKNSGIEWLGQTPNHWSVERLKYSITRIEQGWSPLCENQPAEEGEWGVLKVGCVNRTDFDPNEQKALPTHLEPITSYEIKTTDILMSRGNTRELVGSAALVKDVRPRLLLCDLLYRFRANSRRVEPEYLVLALRSPYVRFQIEREANGTSSSMKKISQSTIGDFLICLPPLEEQRVILGRLRPTLDQIDETISLVRQQSDKIREYRQALITAAVTGKVDLSRVESSTDAVP